jgi:ATP-dependent Lon protease
MSSHYRDNDYNWIKELMNYPQALDQRLEFFEDTSQISVPCDPLDQVIFQDKAKAAIRKIAYNKGHLLMVGRPGTGKSMLANMFSTVLDKSLGPYLRPKDAIVVYPGKDRNHVLFAYESPEVVDSLLTSIDKDLESSRNNMDEFSLVDQIRSLKRAEMWLSVIAVASAIAGVFFTPAFMVAGVSGIGAIFLYLQANNHKAQEKMVRETSGGKQNSLKNIYDMIPEVVYDPRKDKGLMTRVSAPNAKNMKGGFRHDPYQSGNLHTPAHKRAYLGAHAKAPIIYIDELKTLINGGYMSDLLEIMQNKAYVLEGGKDGGSGAADRSENDLRADNMIIACCNHDTLEYLQSEGDGSFLSRIEDKGEIVQMESVVPEDESTIRQVAQYIKQEIVNLGKELKSSWGEILEKEGQMGARVRSELILGQQLPFEYNLETREFTRSAVLEIVKELRCRASDGKLSSILRPINGIIKTAEFKAMLADSDFVEPEHIRQALVEHESLEGALSKELVENKKDLKKFIESMTDSIGYVVGLAVIHSRSSGRMYGQPLPIHGQINAGGSDQVISPGKTGEIAKTAAQNVRASIKKIFNQIGAPYVGYEMHVEYIQAHGGVEGDSASVAMDIALISDYIQRPVNQKLGVTGSLTGDIVLAVGGVTEKIRSIMDPFLGMEGVCIPWQNKHDVEPLLINMEYEYIQTDEIPGIRIFRNAPKQNPFDIFFCKTKYDIYKIMMGLGREEVEIRMVERSRKDLAFIRNLRWEPSKEAEAV